MSASALQVGGNDFLHDLVMADLDPTVRVTSKMDLADFILEVCKPFGIKTVFGNFNLTRNIRTGKQPNIHGNTRGLHEIKTSELKPTVGMKVLEFLHRVVARHGFTIQPGGTRDSLCVTEPQYAQDPLYRFSRNADGSTGNILNGEAERDYSEVPTFVAALGRKGRDEPGGKLTGMRNQLPAFGQGSPAELTKNSEVQSTISNEHGLSMIVEERFNPKKGPTTIYGTDFPLYRPMFYEDKDSGTQEQLDRGMRRQLAEHMKSTLTYTCSVRGHRDPESGALYAYDTIADVADEVEDVEERMWIVSRTFENQGNGPTTTLKMLRLGAYTL